jgi:hypothetical protein
MALFGELSLEEDMDLSQDRLLLGTKLVILFCFPLCVCGLKCTKEARDLVGL